MRQRNESSLLNQPTPSCNPHTLTHMASHRRTKKNTKAAHHNTDLITLDSFEVLGKNHVINSPRSIEACLRLGLDTADLVPKELSDYGGKFIPEFVAQVKYEHAEQRRVDNLKEAVRERNRIIQANSGSADMSASVPSGGGGGGGISHSASAPALVSDMDKELAKRTESMLEQERARLRKAKARQQAEIKSILDHETFLVQMHHQAAIREEKERQRMAVLARKREENAKIEADKKAERREQLLQMREAEEERMKQLAAREFKESLKIAELNKKKEIEIKKHAEQRQAERLKKAAIRRQKTKAILFELERQGDERLKKLMHADEIRLKKQAEVSIVRKREAKMKREASQRRIKLAQEQADAVLEAKKFKVHEKHRLEEIKKHERKIEEDKKTAEKIKEREEKDDVRKERLLDMHEDQIRRVVDFEKKIREGNRYIHIVREKKMKELAIVKTKKELLMQDKLVRIARDQRIKEYKRERTLKHMERAEAKMKETMLRKQKLIDDRKAAAIGIAHRKFQLQRSMNMIRASGKWDLMDCLNQGMECLLCVWLCGCVLCVCY